MWLHNCLWLVRCIQKHPGPALGNLLRKMTGRCTLSFLLFLLHSAACILIAITRTLDAILDLEDKDNTHEIWWTERILGHHTNLGLPPSYVWGLKCCCLYVCEIRMCAVSVCAVHAHTCMCSFMPAAQCFPASGNRVKGELCVTN